VQRGSRNQGHSLIVIDYLGEDVIERSEDRQAGALCRSPDFLANTQMDSFSDFISIEHCCNDLVFGSSSRRDQACWVCPDFYHFLALLCSCLAHLLFEDFSDITNTLILVRFWLTQRAYCGCCLTHLLPVNSGDGQSGLLVDSNADAGRNGEVN